MQCYFADGMYIIRYYRDLLSKYDPLGFSVKEILRKVQNTFLFKRMKESPVIYFSSYVDFISDEVLALIVEAMGYLQIEQMFNGSVCWPGIRTKNERLAVYGDNVEVYHTSNVDITNTVRSGLYCTMDYNQAVQMWSSRLARKVCNYVNVFRVSMYEDLRWNNGDSWECNHGGRLWITDNKMLIPDRFIPKYTLITEYLVNGLNENFYSKQRNRRIIHVLNPLINLYDLVDVCFYWVVNKYKQVPYTDLKEFVLFMNKYNILGLLDDIRQDPEKWKQEMISKNMEDK